MLKVEDLHVNYGGIKAVRGINLNIEHNRIVTLIGANGAGKSSTLRAIMGLVKKAQGKVTYDGEDLTNLSTEEIVKKGIVLVPEGRNVFSNLTVEENLILGAYTIKDKKAIEKNMNRVYDLFPRLRRGAGRRLVPFLEENSRC